MTLLALAPIASAKKKGGGNATKPPSPVDNNMSLAELNQRLIAFEAIDAYQFTPAQLEALEKIAGDLKTPAVKVADPPASKELAAYRAALIELETAMEKGKMEEAQLEELKQKADALAEAAHYEYAAAPEPPEAARKAAAGFARLLRANQLASSISLFAEHVVDPVELARDAAEAKKAAKAANQWPAVRDGAANELGYLLAGWDAAGAKAVAARVSAWLDANPEVDSPLPEAQRTAWDEAAAKMLGDFDSWLVLRRWTERDVARLLCNPQLSAALDARDPSN
jgi:hypothetical protein